MAKDETTALVHIQLLYRPPSSGLGEGVLGQVTITDDPRNFSAEQGALPIDMADIPDTQKALQFAVLQGQDIVATLSCKGVRYAAQLSDMFDLEDVGLLGPKRTDDGLFEGFYEPIAQSLRDALPGIRNVTMQVGNRIREGSPIRRNDGLEAIRQAAMQGNPVDATNIFYGSDPLEAMCERVMDNPELERIKQSPQR